MNEHRIVMTRDQAYSLVARLSDYMDADESLNKFVIAQDDDDDTVQILWCDEGDNKELVSIDAEGWMVVKDGEA